MIDTHTVVPTTGLLNIPADQEQDEMSDPNQADLRVMDSYNPQEPLLQFIREHGVTVVHAMPGRANVIAGQTGIFRTYGRTAEQMRPLKITPDFISTAEGSVLIELGNTRVICTATVDDGVPSFLKGSGKGWVTSEYGMLPRATEERTPREATRGRQSGRTLEIQRLIGRSLRAVTDQEALGERTVWIDCDVIQADGGTRTASITGAFVALALAFERLTAAGILKTSPLIDTVAAMSVGVVDDRALLDLAYEEDSRAEVDMNVVMTGGGHFVEIQATAEGRAFSGSEMQDLLALAAAGIRRLTDEQRALLPLKFSARAR